MPSSFKKKEKTMKMLVIQILYPTRLSNDRKYLYLLRKRMIKISLQAHGYTSLETERVNNRWLAFRKEREQDKGELFLMTQFCLLEHRLYGVKYATTTCFSSITSSNHVGSTIHIHHQPL